MDSKSYRVQPIGGEKRRTDKRSILSSGRSVTLLMEGASE